VQQKAAQEGLHSSIYFTSALDCPAHRVKLVVLFLVPKVYGHIDLFIVRRSRLLSLE
jgi:hypothetical protein